MVPPNPRRKKVRGGSIRGFAGQGFANPHTAELWQKAIFPEYSLRMAKKCPTYAGSQKGAVANPHKPKKPGFANPKTEVSGRPGAIPCRVEGPSHSREDQK